MKLWRGETSFRSWKEEESGSPGTAAVILLIPVLIAAFGFGYDTVRLQYITSWLNKRAILAAEAGASNLQVVEQSGVPLVRLKDTATTVAKDSYLENTETYRTQTGAGTVLTCKPPTIVSNPVSEVSQSPVSPTGECNGQTYQVGAPPTAAQGNSSLCISVNPESYGVGISVLENVQYSFLSIVGISDQLVNPTAVNYVRYRQC